MRISWKMPATSCCLDRMRLENLRTLGLIFAAFCFICNLGVATCYSPFNALKLGFRLDRSDGLLLGLRHPSLSAQRVGVGFASGKSLGVVFPCLSGSGSFKAAVSDVSPGQELWGRWKSDGHGGAGGEGSREWIQRGAPHPDCDGNGYSWVARETRLPGLPGLPGRDVSHQNASTINDESIAAKPRHWCPGTVV